ncbi:uncharacterized protein [Euphorbia lathyris]|uniref:uncharacterized protein n=1 Tax=Euphorbia lathyris TaxID=212925 RepID=UPI0033141538
MRPKQPPNVTIKSVDLHNPFDCLNDTEEAIDLTVSNFNKLNLTPGFTENGSATYLSSGNPCLDFFFHVVPQTPPESIKRRLRQAWNHDPLTTLKLICNLRGVRGTGKSDKEGFYAAALWLHQFHPKSLACNVPSMANFGYFKDLPEILCRILEGSDVRQKQKDEWNLRNSAARMKRYRHFGFRIRRPEVKPKNPNRYRIKKLVSREIRISNALERDKHEKGKASLIRKEKKVAMAKKVHQRCNRDSDFRFLYERVSDFFSDCLKVDMEHLKSDRVTKVSLAAKWCPSIDSSFDRSTLLCESIARTVFTRESYPEYEGVEEAHYAYRIRDRLRKEVLVPLRKILELPEVYIGQNRWAEIPYNRVASVAMKFYKEFFLKHDTKRFHKYLADVKSGKAKIAAGALLPHEIIRPLDDEDDGGQVAELQWKRIVDDLLREGKLKNCLAVSDVSPSMFGTPMEVSVALGLLVSELSEQPWKGKIITFSTNPTLQLVTGENLSEKTRFVRKMEWGQNTDFQKVFDVILKVAVNGRLKEEEMIKRVFVFSDMEFDQASSSPWETDYQVIVKKFTESRINRTSQARTGFLTGSRSDRSDRSVRSELDNTGVQFSSIQFSNQITNLLLLIIIIMGKLHPWPLNFTHFHIITIELHFFRYGH